MTNLVRRSRLAQSHYLHITYTSRAMFLLRCVCLSVAPSYPACLGPLKDSLLPATRASTRRLRHCRYCLRLEPFRRVAYTP